MIHTKSLQPEFHLVGCIKQQLRCLKLASTKDFSRIPVFYLKVASSPCMGFAQKWNYFHLAFWCGGDNSISL